MELITSSNISRSLSQALCEWALMPSHFQSESKSQSKQNLMACLVISLLTFFSTKQFTTDVDPTVRASNHSSSAKSWNSIHGRWIIRRNQKTTRKRVEFLAFTILHALCIINTLYLLELTYLARRSNFERVPHLTIKKFQYLCWHKLNFYGSKRVMLC